MILVCQALFPERTPTSTVCFSLAIEVIFKISLKEKVASVCGNTVSKIILQVLAFVDETRDVEMG